jgi:hypothetical protein
MRARAVADEDGIRGAAAGLLFPIPIGGFGGEGEAALPRAFALAPGERRGSMLRPSWDILK